MTITLPENADLGWLKKTAKRQLKDRRAEGREVHLSDVQFELAKEYGFASWRALKAHLDATATLDGADAFLRGVGTGDLAEVEKALAAQPALVNAPGAHPFWSGQPQPLHVAIDSNRRDMFDRLLNAGADVDGSNEGYDNTSPLMLALYKDRGAMAATLQARGAKIGLGEALLLGDDQRLAELLRSPDWRKLPLPQGSLLGMARTPAAIERLCAEGVDPYLKDRWGSDARDTLSRLGARGEPLLNALAKHGVHPTAETLARVGNLEALRQMAKQKQSEVTADAVVMAAVDFGHHRLVHWLLNEGGNVQARHSFGSEGTALHSAAWNGDLEMVNLLIEHGADLDAVDAEHGTTPLVWAETARVVTNNAGCDEVATAITARANQ